MQMEDLVHDLPFSIDFEQIEAIGEPVAGPVVDFQADGGNGAGNVKLGDSGLYARRRSVLIVPVEELLDRASEEVWTDVSEDRCILVKGGLHVIAPARLS